MTGNLLPMPLVLDAHQLTLIEEWQAYIETGDGPTLHTAAFRRGRRTGSLVLPLAELHGPRLATALAAIGRWAAVLATDALLVVWHDAQLHGALGDIVLGRDGSVRSASSASRLRATTTRQ